MHDVDTGLVAIAQGRDIFMVHRVMECVSVKTIDRTIAEEILILIGSEIGGGKEPRR